jgi:hypothetical protein
MEEKFLIYLIQNKDEFIQLNALNIFYENGNQENFNAIVKKRDVVLSSLFFKLQLVLGIEKDEFILKQNNETICQNWRPCPPHRLHCPYRQGFSH